MRAFAILILTASLVTGCATAPTPRTHREEARRRSATPRDSGSRRIASAVEMLKQGNSSGAARALKAVSEKSAVPGVTDEALFRLALLSLKPTAKRPVSLRGQELFKRLKREYPSSPWTAQALPLLELIKISEELMQQNKDMKAANELLTRKVQELNDNEEQLKKLDLELEQKGR